MRSVSSFGSRNRFCITVPVPDFPFFLLFAADETGTAGNLSSSTEVRMVSNSVLS